ncbi:hypothetical protein [Streptomyces pristinaespiralis]|uniref:hypothetical protein n=1 Tax=Streptomyces pristinaespiralis TaxID=38300 RepID=UPI0033E850EB
MTRSLSNTFVRNPARYTITTLRAARSAVSVLLGSHRVISPQVRASVRLGYQEQVELLWFYRGLYMTAAFLLAFMYYQFDTMSAADTRVYLVDPVVDFWHAYLDMLRSEAYFRAFAIGSVIAVAAATLEYCTAWRYFRMNRKRSWPRRKNALVLAGLHVVVLCGRSSRGDRDLRTLAHAIDVACRHIRRATTSVPTIPVASHRRKELRRHGALVVAAVHRAEKGLDRDRDEARKEIAELMLTICERFTDGRIGALLDESRLTGVEPVSSREWIRLPTAVSLTVGGAVGISFTGLPSSAFPYAVGGVGLLCFTAVYGHRSGRALDLLDSVRGIQRP